MTITAADLFKDLTDVLGENAEASSIRGWLDTGIPELNIALGGHIDAGFPMGRFIEVFGPASAGKTFISTMAMCAVQRLGGIAFYSDHERSFSPEFAAELGLNLDPTVFKHLKPKTFEDSIEAFKKAALLVRGKGLPMEVPCIWVFDSVAAMLPRERFYGKVEGEMRESADFSMRDKMALAVACSQNYPFLKQIAEDYNFTVIVLNQIRVNPGVLFGDPTTTPGGKAAEFYADIRLSLGKKDIVEGAKDEKETVGFEVTAKAIKNKVSRPHRKAVWQVRFNEDGVVVDTISTNVAFMLRKGLLDIDGRFVVWEGKKMYAKQLINELQADPDGDKRLLEHLRDRMSKRGISEDRDGDGEEGNE